MIDSVQLLVGAVSIPSVSGAEREVAEYFKGALSSAYDSCNIDDAGNLIAKVGYGPLRCYLLGHIDTVPGDISVNLNGGILTGRGAVDAKGPFCAAAAAVANLPENILDKITVTLIGAVEEEVSSSKGARYAVQSLPKPDLLVICEPSGWDAITMSYKGTLRARLTLEAPNEHTSAGTPSVGERLVDAWLQIRDWANGTASPGDRVFDRIQTHLEDISVQGDGLLVQATCGIRFRLPIHWTPEKVEASLGELDLNGVTIVASGGERAYRAERDSVLARAFRVAIRSQGSRPRMVVKTGTADMNVVAPFWPVPMLAYGPGDSKMDHRPDEHISIDDYLRSLEVLQDVFRYLAEMHKKEKP